MTNKVLMRLLEQLPPEEEVCVEISECISGMVVDETYAVGCSINEYGQLVLQVDVEKDKFAKI